MTSLPDAINNTTGMVGVQGVGPGICLLYTSRCV